MKHAFGFCLNWLAILFFSYAAIVQLYDDDALVWILVYGTTALLVGTRTRFRILPPVYLGLFLLTLLGVGFVLGASLQSESILKIEERREAAGLLLVALTMFGLFLVTCRKDPAILNMSGGDGDGGND